jgi:hypothetical protein
MADPVIQESARSMALGGFGEKFMLIVVRLPVMKSSPNERARGRFGSFAPFRARRGHFRFTPTIGLIWTRLPPIWGNDRRDHG